MIRRPYIGLIEVIILAELCFKIFLYFLTLVYLFSNFTPIYILLVFTILLAILSDVVYIVYFMTKRQVGLSGFDKMIGFLIVLSTLFFDIFMNNYLILGVIWVFVKAFLIFDIYNRRAYIQTLLRRWY